MGHVPQFSHEDVLRILARDYPAEDREAILGLLASYGPESHEQEPHRVRLAILKLADGKTDAIPDCVRTANRDYRDVLAWAEYPNVMELGVPDGPDAADRRRQAQTDDSEQYERWLHRH